eukprot:462957-Hanusia_phi.AAC.1
MNSQGSHSTPASPFDTDDTLNLQAFVPSSPLSSERSGRDAGTAGSGPARSRAQPRVSEGPAAALGGAPRARRRPSVAGPAARSSAAPHYTTARRTARGRIQAFVLFTGLGPDSAARPRAPGPSARLPEAFHSAGRQDGSGLGW